MAPLDIPQEHPGKNIEFQPEFHINVARSPSPKKIDSASDRDGPFNGYGGASGTGREHEDSNELMQINPARIKNVNLSSQIDRLPNIDSKQLSEGEENVMATLRQSEEGEAPRSLENVELSDDNSGSRPENLSEEANSGLDKHEWNQ